MKKIESNHLGIDVGKRKCRAVAIKDDKGKVLDNSRVDNNLTKVNEFSILLVQVITLRSEWNHLVCSVTYNNG